jgi:hypothetical protein
MTQRLKVKGSVRTGQAGAADNEDSRHQDSPPKPALIVAQSHEETRPRQVRGGQLFNYDDGA